MQEKWMHSNWIRKKAKSIKCDNNKQQKNTQLLAVWRNDSPMGQGSTQQSVIRRGSANLSTPPPLILLYTIFDRKGSPFVYLLLTNDTPSNCRKCSIFLQIMNKSISQEVFVTLIQLQNASVIYPFWFFVPFNILQLEKSLPIRTWSLNKKKILLSSRSHGTSPYRPF